MRETDSYFVYNRKEWNEFGSKEFPPFANEEIEVISSKNKHVKKEELREVYRPIVYLVSKMIHMAEYRNKTINENFSQSIETGPFIVGITGSVSAGKSTFAKITQDILEIYFKDKSVELITTDGFLLNNQRLERRGLMDRKGFPETYDRPALIRFLRSIKNNEEEVEFPVYSHKIYDIVPGQTQSINQPDILIIEGINVLQTPAEDHFFIGDFCDFTIYLDASQKYLESWYLDRFRAHLRKASGDPTSYYQRYLKMGRMEALNEARKVWREINLKNLYENILPSRGRASLILHKTKNHRVDEILFKKGL